ncbi:MAG: histone deacetylase [Planctomycetales bacterium]|nr:histone deacetylase [Planctomycetales bacterium]
MTLLYYDPQFQEHKTGEHPESGKRLLAVTRHLHFIGLDSSCVRPSWEEASVERLCYAHTPEYVKSIERFASLGGGQIDADTLVSPQSYEVARLAAGAVCDAVIRVHAGQDQTAFCLVRPPGHHAMADRAMGFCLFNNVAVAARVATRELGLERVLIVDFDVHHGNGTQAIFWQDAQVGYFSMHRAPFYPGTGAADEIGDGPGAGTICNVPIALGTPPAEQLALFEQKLHDFAAHMNPQLILVSAGFDSHKEDPIGSLGLESEDFRPLTRCLLDVAREHAAGKLVSILEGGYNPDALTDSVTIHLEELLHSSP